MTFNSSSVEAIVEPYPTEIEEQMRTFHQTLNEKDRRRYAGIEAIKLGHGGITYISRVLGCSRPTIISAIRELENLDESPGPTKRIRTKGGGRKPIEEIYPNIDEVFLEVVKSNTAGDPQDDKLIWTNLTLQQVVERLEERDISVSHTVAKKLLKKHNFKRRKAQKKRP